MNFSIQSVYNWYRDTIRNPKYRWWIILGTLVYLLSPFDISPDFLPILGEIDDFVLSSSTSLRQEYHRWETLFRDFYYAEDALNIKRTASSESNEKIWFISRVFKKKNHRSLIKEGI